MRRVSFLQTTTSGNYRGGLLIFVPFDKPGDRHRARRRPSVQANRLVNILSSLVCLPPPGPECGSGRRESLWGQVRGRVECFGIGRRGSPCMIVQLH
jgi:hypothetical protein